MRTPLLAGLLVFLCTVSLLWSSTVVDRAMDTVIDMAVPQAAIESLSSQRGG